MTIATHRVFAGVPAALLLGVGLALAQPPAPACACSCAALTTQQYVAGADLVARARLDQLGTATTGSSGQTVTHRFVVSGIYKGAAPTVVDVHSAASGASCGLEGLEQGKEYLLFADQDGAAWRAGLCGGTTAWDEGRAQEVARITGPVTSPTPAPAAAQAPGLPRHRWAAAAGGLLVTLVAAGAFVVWWASRRGRHSTGS